VRSLVCSYQRIDLGFDHRFQLPDHREIRINVASFLPIPNLLAIEVDFKPTIRPRSQGDCNVAAEGPEEFVGHPRGRGVMLSRDAVQDVYDHLPFGVC